MGLSLTISHFFVVGEKKVFETINVAQSNLFTGMFSVEPKKDGSSMTSM